MLTARANEVALQELAMAAELGRLIHSLTTAGLKPVVLKGVSVAVQAYGRLGLRQNRDIDLLVRPAEVMPALTCLAGLGYTAFEPPDAFDPQAFVAWGKRHKDVALRKGPFGPIVELHWRLFDVERSANGHEQISLSSVHLPGVGEILCLAPTTALIYMCEHGAEHAWSRLKWLADLNALLGRMTPEEVVGAYSESRELGRWRAVAIGIHLAAALMEGSRYPDVEADARRGKTRWLGWAAVEALNIGEREEFELHPYGSTIKTASRYLLSDDWRFLGRQLAADLNEIPKSYGSARLRRWGLLVKGPLWVYGRWRAATRRTRMDYDG